MRSNKRPAKDSIDDRSTKRIKSQLNYFDMLPDELLQQILAYSPEIGVCSRFRNVTRNRQFWRSACFARWGEDLPIKNITNKKWMYDNAHPYVFPSDGNEADWETYYSLRSYFCLILHEVNEWKEMERDFLIENSELSVENFQQFFKYIHHFEYSLTSFLLKLLPIFISNRKLGLLSHTAAYFSNMEYFGSDSADLELIKQLWKISQELDVPELQYEYFHSTCKQFQLIQEYNEESKAVFKNLVLQMIQHGVEEEPRQNDQWRDHWDWIYPSREFGSCIVFPLLNKNSPQLNEMIEYLSDIILESFHETDNELQQTSAIGVFQMLNDTHQLPARLIALALEALRKKSEDVRYAGLVLAVKLLLSKQQLELKKRDVSFLFDELLCSAEQRARTRYYYIMEPVYRLVSRFPSEFISNKQIEKFTSRCGLAMSINGSMSDSILRNVKYIHKIAFIWKERMTDIRILKRAYECLKSSFPPSSPEQYISFYIRAGYNALGMKFQDDVIKFIEEAKENKAISMAHLYAFCGDIFYEVFKNQNKTEEINSMISAILELFKLLETKEPTTEPQDEKKIRKRYRRLKKACKKEQIDQNTMEFIRGLFKNEPEIKPQIKVFHSYLKITRPDKDALCKAGIKSLIHIAMDLRSDPKMLGTRAKILTCCLQYQSQDHYKKSKVGPINMLYEDLVPSLSFGQRAFFAKKTIEVVRARISSSRNMDARYRRHIDYTSLIITAARSMLLNPVVNRAELSGLIDCLKLAYAEPYPLPVSFASFIGLILALRSKDISSASVHDSTLDNWIVESFEAGSEEDKNDATRVCAILSSRIDHQNFQDLRIRIKFRTGVAIEDLRIRAKSLMKTLPLDISAVFMKEFIFESDSE